MSEFFFHQKVNNLNVESISPLITPEELKENIVPGPAWSLRFFAGRFPAVPTPTLADKSSSENAGRDRWSAGLFGGPGGPG